jgi:hypothetical protein
VRADRRRFSSRVPSRRCSPVPTNQSRPSDSVPLFRPLPSPLGEGRGEGGFVSEFSLCPSPTILSRPIRARISNHEGTKSTKLKMFWPCLVSLVPWWFQRRFVPPVPSRRISPVPSDRTPQARRGRFPPIQKRIPTPPGLPGIFFSYSEKASPSPAGILFRSRRGSFPRRAEPIGPR